MVGAERVADTSIEQLPVQKRPRRRWGLLVFILSAVGVLTGAGWWLSGNPVLVAMFCPSCFGFERLSDRVFIEPGITVMERRRLESDLAAAGRRVGDMYGTLQARPVVLVCYSKACDRRIGGKGARAATYGWHVIRVSPRGSNTVILAHELAHAEFHYRVGWIAMLTSAYPAWFDEGLAVLVSRDPRSLRLSRLQAPRCRVVMAPEEVARLPRTPWDWSSEMWRTRDLYEKAACAVARWYQAAGREGVLSLIEDLRSGARFATAFEKKSARR